MALPITNVSQQYVHSGRSGPTYVVVDFVSGLITMHWNETSAQWFLQKISRTGDHQIENSIFPPSTTQG